MMRKHLLIRYVLVCALLSAGLSLAHAMSPSIVPGIATIAGFAQDNGQGKTLRGYVPSPVQNGAASSLGHHRSDDIISLAISLPLRDTQGLDQYLRDVNDPASPRYHHFMTKAEVDQAFNPTAQEEAQAIQWLNSHGFTVTGTYANHLVIDAQATVDQVERAFHITLNDYRAMVHGKERVFYAPNTDPTIDSSAGTIINSITGLDNYPRVHIQTNGNVHNAPAYYPQDLANAYDANPLWNGGYNGAGQHIGITLWTVPPTDSTLQHFASVTGANVATVANGRLKVIPVDGGTTDAMSPDQGEAGMDIEYSSGMAPGATVDYYEAPTDPSGNPTGQGLIDTLNQAGTDAYNNQVITNSWGGCEASSLSDPFTSAIESVLASNAATGHDYFFSSGDNGSWCAPGGAGTGQTPYPGFPASSPYVTSVGGTRFSASVNGGYPGEFTWDYCATCNGGNPEGTGGGYSNLFSRPAWQSGSGLAPNGKRGYPDIAAEGDPSTGAYVCYGSSSTCGQFGGTSLSSPLWAGMVTVANQYLSAQNKPPVGFMDSALYTLATNKQTYPPFHDITAGTNGGYNAGTAWDAATGWGTPDMYNVARDLAAPGGGQSTPTATATLPPTGIPHATATGAPVSTPSATLTATPPPSTVQLITNGGFESGISPWQGSSAANQYLVSPTRPHSGTSSANLCGYNSCNDQIWQTVALPSTMSRLTMSFWVYLSTQETSSITCNDAFHSLIRTSAGNTITTVRNLCNINASSNWVQISVDLTTVLSAYKGQPVQVYFQGTTNASLPSNFFVDDVSLVATTSGSTPTPTAVSTVGATPTPTTTPVGTGVTCPGSQSGCMQQMLNLINGDRAQYGLPAYSLNLTQSNGSATCVGSYGHPTAMQQSGTIWHTNPSYPKASFPTDICVPYMTAGENVGESASGNELTDLQNLNAQMMKEPHDSITCATTTNHACNILSTSFHQMGIGIYSYNGVTWLTQDFVN